MTAALRALVSKLAALALLAALLYAVTTLVASPLIAQHTALKDDIETQRTLLGRLTAAASEASQAESQGRAPQDAINGPVFLPGGSDAARIAGLQSKLGELAESLGIRLASTLALPARQDHGVRRTGVQTQFSAKLEAIQKLIHGLESSAPPLFVESLSVSHGPDRGSEDEQELDVRLLVFGATEPQKTEPQTEAAP